jgi:hypothetical protein
MRNGWINKHLDFSRSKITYRRMCFTFVTMMLCYAIGSYIMCADLTTVPKQDRDPSWYAGRPNISDKTRFWEWNMGNGYVSEIEHIVMMLSLFFGFLRTLDLLIEWGWYDKQNQ